MADDEDASRFAGVAHDAVAGQWWARVPWGSRTWVRGPFATAAEAALEHDRCVVFLGGSSSAQPLNFADRAPKDEPDFTDAPAWAYAARQQRIDVASPLAARPLLSGRPSASAKKRRRVDDGTDESSAASKDNDDDDDGGVEQRPRQPQAARGGAVGRGHAKKKLSKNERHSKYFGVSADVDASGARVFHASTTLGHGFKWSLGTYEDEAAAAYAYDVASYFLRRNARINFPAVNYDGVPLPRPLPLTFTPVNDRMREVLAEAKFFNLLPVRGRQPGFLSRKPLALRPSEALLPHELAARTKGELARLLLKRAFPAASSPL